MTRSLSAKFVPIAIGGVIGLLCLEIAIGMAAWLAPSLFQRRSEIVRAIERTDQATLDRMQKIAVVPQVWDAQPNSTGTLRSCLGPTYASSIGGRRERIYKGYDANAARVLLAGDSYTHGDEVGDDSTISAHLFKQTGIVSANLGLGGYSTVQAFLKLQQQQPEFPEAKIAVLGVMFENIRRNVNSYSPAINNRPEDALQFRPYVRIGELRFVPREALLDRKSMQDHARQLLETDFWQTPEARFPYTLSTYRMVTSTHFSVRTRSRIMALFGRQYGPDFDNAEMSNALTVIVRQYLDWAQTKGLRGIVVFIPQNKYDTTSPKDWMARYEAAYGVNRDIVLADLGQVDWARYNQQPNGGCHPSDYGYSVIATAYAKVLGAKVR